MSAPPARPTSWADWGAWAGAVGQVFHCDPSDEIDNIQFCNWIYRDYEPKGPEFGIVQPIISHPDLKVCSIHRIKANLNLRTPKIIKHGFHRDGTGSFMVAIYYVNTNDGYTEFEDGTQVESIENRLLVFDSSLKHTGTTCTNAKVRCVINFNYHYGA